MTPLAAAGGRNETSPESMSSGMRQMLQPGGENMALISQLRGLLAGTQALPPLVPESVGVPKFVDIVTPYADGKAIAAAGISTEWSRVAHAAGGLASGVRWDLVKGGVVNPPIPQAVPAATQQFAAAATNLAKRATTIADFGDALQALREDAGKSLNDLADYGKAKNDKGANIVGMSKTALSDACQGRRLFRTSQPVPHFLAACGAEADVDVWLAAWQRAKKNQGARPQGSGPMTAGEQKPPDDTAAGGWLSGSADEVLQVIQIPITRGHIRGAVIAMAILGLVASSTNAPAVRAAGLAALGLATGITLVDQAHAVRQLLAA